MESTDLLHYLRLIPDPRLKRTRKHELPELLFIALAGVLCGAECWTQVEEFGKANRS